MALTDDEEAQVRSLLATLRKLPDVPTRAGTVKDPPSQQAFSSMEGYLRTLVAFLRRF